jgi:hypothetical protein
LIKPGPLQLEPCQAFTIRTFFGITSMRDDSLKKLLFGPNPAAMVFF